MRKIKLSILAIVAICSIQSAMAWGTPGHLSSAYIAELHLTPEAKAKCRYYLKHTLPYYAMWMDCWRGVKEYEAINNGHSLRTTEDGRKITWEAFPSTAGGGGAIATPPGRAMGHLYNAMNELGNGKYKNLPDSVVRQRLINMIHYVADMHCPSHTGFPEKFYPIGKKYDLKRNGKYANFHGFWDGSAAYKRKNWTLKKYAEMLDNVSPKQVKKWQRGLDKKDLRAGIGSWGKECIENAHEAYAIIPEGTDLAKLTKEQQKQVQELSARAILTGGYRLAYVLNTLFAE